MATGGYWSVSTLHDSTFMGACVINSTDGEVTHVIYMGYLAVRPATVSHAIAICGCHQLEQLKFNQL